MANICDLSALKILDLYRTRQLSPVEVLQSVYNNIDKLDRKIHAMTSSDREGALLQAQKAEQAWLDGNAAALCGLPVAVKDTIEVQGLPTTYGSVAFRDNYAPDSEVALRLKKAGAIIVGKTNTSEFALSTFCANELCPPTLNPADLNRTAGGSSGGSAAAVAAGMVPLSVGTDSAGSVRIPAAFCGIFGIKPSFGTIPFWQNWRASPTRSHIGVFSKNAIDSQLAITALSGNYGLDQVLAGITAVDSLDQAVAILQNLNIKFLADDPNYDDVCSKAVAILEQHRLKIKQANPMPEFNVPTTLRDGEPAFSGDHYCAAERLRSNFWERHFHDLSDYARPIYDAGRNAKAWQYREMLDSAEHYKRAVHEWFDQDILIGSACPEAPLQPPTTAECGLGPRYQNISIWNFAHNPAAVVPIGRGANGAPVAVQIVGRYGADNTVFLVAACLEKIFAAVNSQA